MKKYILDTVQDSVANLLYYDRKEDEQLPRGAIENCIASGEITIEEIVSQFDKSLRKGLKQEK